MKPATIDVHAHFFPESFFRVVDEAGAPFGARVDRSHPAGPVVDTKGSRTAPLEASYWDLDLRRKAMDKAGVDVHALSLTAPMVYFADGPTGTRLARAVNDAMDAAHTAFPDRFVGCATLPMQDPPAHRELSDPAFAPIWERCQAARLPVLLHPLNVIGLGTRLSRFYLNNFLGNPFDTAIAAAHLVFGGVLDRFPKLEVCLPHAGGAMPYLMGRLTHGQRVRPETKGVAKKPFEAYLRRFTYDTIAHSPHLLRFLVDTVGADRVMLGSDYCFDMGYQRPVDVVTKHAKLSRTDQRRILGATAARLLRLA